MKLVQLCHHVSEELNEGGYTPAIADNDSQFNAFCVKSIGPKFNRNGRSKGRTLNWLLTGTDLTDNEKSKLLLDIADKIEYFKITTCGFGESEFSKKHQELADLIRSIVRVSNTECVDIDDLFLKVSLSNQSFINLNEFERLREIVLVTENLLMSNNGLLMEEMRLNWEKYSYSTLNNNVVRKFRKLKLSFRHAKDESIEERNSYTKEELKINIEFGLYIIRVIKLYVECTKEYKKGGVL